MTMLRPLELDEDQVAADTRFVVVSFRINTCLIVAGH